MLGHLFHLLLLFPSILAELNKDEIMTRTLNNLLLNYDRRVRPGSGHSPVEVLISMHILGITEVSEVDMEFKTDLYFRQYWTDPRLAYINYPPSTILNLTGSAEGKLPPEVKLDYDAAKMVWSPDSFFPSERTSYIHQATIPNEFIRVTDQGFITKSSRFTLSTTCPMDLKYFPMDSQVCSIRVESYGYTMDDLIFKWNKDGMHGIELVRVDVPIVSDFKTIGYRLRSMAIHLSTGNYTVLSCDIQLKRAMGYYIMQIYLPSGMLVIVSWLSLWMDVDSISDRISMNLTTMLTIVMLLSNVNSSFPKIPYVKAIDVYTGWCFTSIFISLLENSIVGYLCRRKTKGPTNGKISPGPAKTNPNEKAKLNFDLKKFEEMKKKLTYEDCVRVAQQMIAQELVTIQKDAWEDDTHFLKKSTKIMGKADKDKEVDISTGESQPWSSYVDLGARIIFPTSFVIFNVFYWTYYLKASTLQIPDFVLLK